MLEAYLEADGRLRQPLFPRASQLLRGELLFAVERQWARTLEDVLLRRTGVAAAGHPGLALVNSAADVLQPALDWSDGERREQLDSFNGSFHFAGNIPEG
jgi:glycerol-3-phosphate dehydrogenase